MIGNLWSEYIRSTTKHRSEGDLTIVDAVSITPADVARMMDLLKIARSVHGDPLNVDNYVDGAGYQALAGMLELGDREVPSVTPKTTPSEEVAKSVDLIKAKQEADDRTRRQRLADDLARAQQSDVTGSVTPHG